jgi:hypothetical protein
MPPDAQLCRSSLAVAAMIVLSGAAVVPTPSLAATVIFRTDAQLVAASARIVHGRVIRQRFERPDAATGSIYTVTTLAVIEDFTGIAEETVEVWELGGTFGGQVLWIGGAVRYEPGSRVLVCLERGPFGYRSIAMGFSKFDVEPTATSGGILEGRLHRNLQDTAVVGGLPLRSNEPTLAGFRELTMKVRGVAAVRNRRAEPIQADPNVSAGFTFLGPARWVEADSGTPVRWYTNTTAATPLIGGDGINELRSALSAWTVPATASIILQYAGTTNQIMPEGPWSGLPTSGTSVLTFEDPHDEISGFTLAIGGGWYWPGAGGSVNGQLFGAFARGYVVFQNAADLAPTFRQSRDYARVLEHEIGHTIGLGHSGQGSANIMFASCCYSDTPVVPGLGPDDLAAVNFIYPTSTPPPPPACTYSLSLKTVTRPAPQSSSSLTVTTTAGCSWTAVSNSPFLTLTSSASNSGSGTASFSIAANTSSIPRSGTLTIAGQTVTVNQDGARVIGDLDGDRTADLMLFRPSTGKWLIRYSSTGFSTGADLELGAASDRPVPGDYDGDGRLDLAVWRPSDGIWYVTYSSTGTVVELQWGVSTDVPVQGDYTGDGRTDLAVWRPASGVWYIFDLAAGSYMSRQWGTSTDVPLTGDFDGDGHADVAVFRPSYGYWYVIHSSTQTYSVYQWGISTDTPQPADYDGDGRTDLAVYRPANGYWFVYDLKTGQYVVYQWGASGDVPAPNDYDGDGRANIAVWRPTGTWFIYYPTRGTYQAVPHGAEGDSPIR